MASEDIVIASAQRTPIGCFLSSLSALSAPKLGAAAIAAAVDKAGLDAAAIDEVIMGLVLPAGVGQAPARQAALAAGLPQSVSCTTVNKVCGSGLKAVMLARQAISSGAARIVVAGGMESMSNAPHLLPASRRGVRMGPGQLVDSMIYDGIWDPYDDRHMGSYGELCARQRGCSREQQDQFAAESYRRALQAQQEGAFVPELAPVTAPARQGPLTVDVDEEPGNFRPEKAAQLRGAFEQPGTITAANASKISDGAAALVVTSRGEAQRQGCPILATILADASHAQDPAWFTTAPIAAIRRAADQAAVAVTDIDLLEINEAFAVVPMVAIEELGLRHDRVNVHGGAISLGHPIGCSGARVLVTLLHALHLRGAELGCAALCIGGGEAVAMILRRE